MSNKKIAICFSGAPREFKSCYPHYKQNILDVLSSWQYEIDTFISCWNHVIPQNKHVSNDEGTFDEVLDLYKPLQYNHEDYTLLRKEELAQQCKLYEFQQMTKCECKQKSLKCKICGSQIAHNQLGMLYNIWKSDQLRQIYEEEHGFNYNYVIRNRFDNLFLEPIKKEFLPQKGQLFIPEGTDNKCQYGSGPDDQTAIGTSDTMCVYTSVYSDIDRLIFFNYKECGGWGLPHRAIQRQLDKNDIEIVRLPWKRCLCKKRHKFYPETKLLPRLK